MFDRAIPFLFAFFTFVFLFLSDMRSWLRVHLYELLQNVMLTDVLRSWKKKLVRLHSFSHLWSIAPNAVSSTPHDQAFFFFSPSFKRGAAQGMCYILAQLNK